MSQDDSGRECFLLSGVAHAKSDRAFSILEVLISAVLLLLLVGITMGIITSVQNIFGRTSAQIEQFRTARHALETIARRVSQATLNPYWVVTLDESSSQPNRFERGSELRFLCGRASDLIPGAAGGGSALFFQSPTGFFSDGSGDLGAALNTWGYYVEYGSDRAFRPEFLNSEGVPEKFRFRLVEVIDPSDSLSVFDYTSGQPDYSGIDWILDPTNVPAQRRVLAENVLAFVVLPRLSDLEDSMGTGLAPNLNYDSTDRLPDPRFNPRNQLPPILEIAMVVIDDRSAARIDWTSSPPDLGTDFGSLFRSAADLENDLQTLRDNLIERGLEARILRQTVPIISAKWSTEQEN